MHNNCKFITNVKKKHTLDLIFISKTIKEKKILKNFVDIFVDIMAENDKISSILKLIIV